MLVVLGEALPVRDVGEPVHTPPRILDAPDHRGRTRILDDIEPVGVAVVDRGLELRIRQAYARRVPRTIDRLDLDDALDLVLEEGLEVVPGPRLRLADRVAPLAALVGDDRVGSGAVDGQVVELLTRRGVVRGPAPRIDDGERR